MEDIALKIKLLLAEKKITNIELSTKIGKSVKSVYNYLENKTTIDVLTLQKIAEVLDVEIGYFFGYGNDKVETIVDYTHTYLNIYYLIGFIDDFLNEFKKIYNSNDDTAEKSIQETQTYKKYLMFLAILAKDKGYNKTISDLKAAAKEFNESKERL